MHLKNTDFFLVALNIREIRIFVCIQKYILFVYIWLDGCLYN